MTITPGSISYRNYTASSPCILVRCCLAVSDDATSVDNHQAYCYNVETIYNRSSVVCKL